MNLLEQTLEVVKSLLPPPGTELGCYVFLSPDALWTGTLEDLGPYVAVAEDNWPGGGGPFLLAAANGPVYVGDRSDDLRRVCLLDYCAASFSQFMEIFRLYRAAVERIPDPGLTWNEALEETFAEAEQALRQQIQTIDPTAIEDEESFWSTILEEFGAGM